MPIRSPKIQLNAAHSRLLCVGMHDITQLWGMCIIGRQTDRQTERGIPLSTWTILSWPALL